MQTFLPYQSFTQSAKVLDRQRLGKQRVESWQILGAIEKRKAGITKGAWINHPCVLMWVGFESLLIEYSIAICNEWLARGYKDTMLSRFQAKALEYAVQSSDQPIFLGNDQFHASHRSNLLKKNFDYYSSFFDDDPNQPYLWLNDLERLAK